MRRNGQARLPSVSYVRARSRRQRRVRDAAAAVPVVSFPAHPASLPVRPWHRRGALAEAGSFTMAPPPRPASPPAFLPPSAYGASATVPAGRPLSPRPRAVVGPPPPVSAARTSSWTGALVGSWTRCTSPLPWGATPTQDGSSTGRLPGVVSMDDVRGGGGRAAAPSAPFAPPLPRTTMAADRAHRTDRCGGLTTPSVVGSGGGGGVRPASADGDGGDVCDGADAPPVRRVRLLPRLHVPRAVGSALAVLRVGGARGRPGGGGGASWAVDAGSATAGEGRDAGAGRRGIARPLPVRPLASAAGVLAPPSAPPPGVDLRPGGLPRPSPPAPVVAPAVVSPPGASPPNEASALPPVKAQRGRKPRLPRLVSAPPTASLTVPSPVATPVAKPRRGRPRLSPPAAKGAVAPVVESLQPDPGAAAKPRRGRPRLSPPPPVKRAAVPTVEPLRTAPEVAATPRRGRPPRPVAAASLTVQAPRRRGRPPASASAPVVALPASGGVAIKRPRGRPPRVPQVEAVSTARVVAPTAPTKVPLALPSPLHQLPLAKPAPAEAAPRARKPHGYWNELRNVETELVAANVALVSLARVPFLSCLARCDALMLRALAFALCVPWSSLQYLRSVGVVNRA